MSQEANPKEQISSESYEPHGHRPTWAEINLDALASNFHLIRERVGPTVKVMAVVKADAYGHGAVQCALRLAKEGVDWFGVALPEEGIELREAGITEPILCLGGFWGGQENAVLKRKLTPVVYRVDMVQAINQTAKDAGVVADVHVKIDTGMGRLGVRFDAVNDFLSAIGPLENARVDGLMTHFAAADEPQSNRFTSEQIKRFNDGVAAFRASGHRPQFIDLANSAGVVAHKEGYGNLVRPGGILYGLWKDVLPPMDQPINFRPVMSLRSRITLLKRVPSGETLGYGRTFQTTRESLIATLPIGYHDGYMRRLSNNARVIVRGKFAPVVGRISMDMTLIDVTDIEGVRMNDAVTLLGEENSLSITAEELAQQAGTLSYEVTCGISSRVPRIVQQF
jgi:alanine racemase